jgi:TFIIH basal transcription factor complex TTD-A subunit
VDPADLAKQSRQSLSVAHTLLSDIQTPRTTSTHINSNFKMVKAVRGTSITRSFHPLNINFVPGMLVKCDASIKAMLVDIDEKANHEFIIEELDEEHILVKEQKINELKARLNQVCRPRRITSQGRR